MKLVLAKNQSRKFVDFYAELKQQSQEPFDYSGYNSLLFVFGGADETPLRVINLDNGRELTDYNGVYINGYMNSYEQAAAVAIACSALGVPYVNKELHDPPSLSKLSGYAKLAAAGTRIPRTFAGAKSALLSGIHYMPTEGLFPAILKRADADRGIDNFKVTSYAEVKEILEEYDTASLWLLQEFIPNEGFYLVSYYDQKPTFSIYRTLEARPDGNPHKAHMYKPRGGSNARLVELTALPEQVSAVCLQAITAVNRQIGSVDCVVDSRSGEAYVLEVNYNPQLVTIETFKDVRVQAFLDNLNRNWT